MSKILEFEEHTPLEYFTHLVNFIYDPQYARYLRRIAERYDREALPEDLQLMPFFVDALIFETFIDGKSPLDRFLDTYREQLSPEQRRVYQGFKQYRFGCYQVLEQRGREDALLRDLLDNSEVLMRDSHARSFMFPQFYVVVRLLPFEDYHIPTGACTVLNVDSDEAALEFSRLLRQAPLIVDSES